MGSHLVSPVRSAAIAVLGVLLAGASAVAQPNPAVQKMVELNRQALNAYAAGDFEAAKTALLDAVVQGKGAGLGDDRMMARTFVHLGAVYIDGLKDRPRGLRYFVNALRMRPEIKLTPSLVTPSLSGAFEEARREAATGGTPAPMPPPAPPAAPEPPPTTAAPATPIIPAQGSAGGGDEPDFPATLTSPLQCPSPDEAPPGQPIFLRCVPGSEVPVARMLLFYRLPGAEKFASTRLARTPRGWWTGEIPAAAVEGKSVQFYVEARDAGGQQAATNGRVDSPNLILVRAGAAVVGKSSLPGLRTGGAAAIVGDENPLEELARERANAREPGVHRRKVKAFWFGLGVGTGFGWHRATKLEFRTDLKVEKGLGAAGLFYLSPEIGYQFNEYFGVSVLGRHQFIPGETSGPPDNVPGGPARGAHSALVKFSYFGGSGNFQAVISAIGGAGEGFRVQVPPAPTTDSKTSLPRNDTVRGGPYLAGAGLSLLYHFAPHFALALDVKGLIGFPDSGDLLDVGLGTQFGF